MTHAVVIEMAAADRKIIGDLEIKNNGIEITMDAREISKRVQWLDVLKLLFMGSLSFKVGGGSLVVGALRGNFAPATIIPNGETSHPFGNSP